MPSGEGDKYPPMVNLQQYYIEQFLIDAIAEVNARAPGSVEIRWASQIVSCEAGAAGIELRVENARGGYQTRADWVVACDGGQSFVRSSLGLQLKGTGYEGRYAIVDIELPSTYPTERRAWFDPPWARGTTVLMHRQPDNIWRVDYQLAGSVDASHALEPGQVQEFVQTHLEAIGEGHLTWSPVWSSVYRAGAMTLDAYRHGRILFAGNAAHAMPIFGVRGLNSGFDDADNLVWKLAAVLHGKGREALLDSYSVERVQAFHVNAASARRSTEFMSPPNRGSELMREAALSLAGQHQGIARLINPRQTHAITYIGSPLSSGDESLQPGLQPGAPLVDASLRDGRHLSDLLAGNGFTLLAFSPFAMAEAVESATDSPQWSFLRCRSALLELGADLASWAADLYGAKPGAAYLVRPDGHICARWQSPPNVDAVLAAIRCACGEPEILQ